MLVSMSDVLETPPINVSHADLNIKTAPKDAGFKIDLADLEADHPVVHYGEGRPGTITITEADLAAGDQEGREKGSDLKSGKEKKYYGPDDIKALKEKKGLPDFDATVALAVDNSGSLQHDYTQGIVRKVGSLVAQAIIGGMNARGADVYMFREYGPGITEHIAHKWMGRDLRQARRLDPLTPDNLQAYAEKNFGPQDRYTNTLYTPLLKDAMQIPVESTQPRLVVFVTDGENQDPVETETYLQKMSDAGSPAFVVFVKSGRYGNKEYYNLDSLKENVRPGDFGEQVCFAVIEDDVMKMTPQQLAEQILTPFHNYLGGLRQKGVLDPDTLAFKKEQKPHG